MDAALPSDPPGPGLPVPADLEAVLAALVTGDDQPVGRFRVDLAEGRWWWSDEVYTMHGFAPGEVVPTTPLVLAHRHPEDRDGARPALLRSARTGDPFGSMHRIVDASGDARTLVVAAQGRRSRATGQVVEVSGYLVDVTEPHRSAAQREATAAIMAADASRSVIEQARGVLMVAYGVGPDEAFELLRKRSNDTNVPVRDLARSLLEGLRAHGGEARTRELVEQVLGEAVVPAGDA
ncbi:PAS and ANTAR domain-containing protein [Cellulosimicrobium cellulans]|uniref:PAS and ANTAR domain-containing protein n=1 Tax=Cellulosimicrobium cellulans TaxID=1710 RepID=UPI000848A4F4|nr:PAS and ANTAR domain-containing protein [Cellulosimicrobium cellulans]